MLSYKNLPKVCFQILKFENNKKKKKEVREKIKNLLIGLQTVGNVSGTQILKQKIDVIVV